MDNYRMFTIDRGSYVVHEHYVGVRKYMTQTSYPSYIETEYHTDNLPSDEHGDIQKVYSFYGESEYHYSDGSTRRYKDGVWVGGTTRQGAVYEVTLKDGKVVEATCYDVTLWYDNGKPKMRSQKGEVAMVVARTQDGEYKFIAAAAGANSIAAAYVVIGLFFGDDVLKCTQYYDCSSCLYNSQYLDVRDTSDCVTDDDMSELPNDVAMRIVSMQPVVKRTKDGIVIEHYAKASDVLNKRRTTTSAAKYFARATTNQSLVHQLTQKLIKNALVYSAEVKFTNDWEQVAEIMNNIGCDSSQAKSCMTGDFSYELGVPHPDYGYEVTHPYQVFDYPGSKWEFAYIEDDNGSVLFRALMYDKYIVRSFGFKGSDPHLFTQRLVNDFEAHEVCGWADYPGEVLIRKIEADYSVVCPYLDGDAGAIEPADDSNYAVIVGNTSSNARNTNGVIDGYVCTECGSFQASEICIDDDDIAYLCSHCDDTVWCEYSQRTVRESDAVYCEWLDSNLARDEAVYSEYIEDWLPESSPKVIWSDYSEDYVVKNHSESIYTVDNGWVWVTDSIWQDTFGDYYTADTEKAMTKDGELITKERYDEMEQQKQDTTVAGSKPTFEQQYRK